MAEIRPFRALRYDVRRVPIGKVVTQPYDKITPSMREAYLNAHPRNLVRILRPADMPVGEGESPYAVAARLWKEWRREGIIERMSGPSLFAYHQVFRVPGVKEPLTRKGCVALARLESYDRGVIFPHERRSGTA